MIRYTRGSKIVISTIFYDTSGDIAYPSTVTLTIAHPSASTSSRWPVDGTELETTTLSMTTPSTATTSAVVGQWLTTWNSAISGRGLVSWTAVPSTLNYGVNEGKFELRGGLASSLAVASTLA
jgi:hypothetical protein